MLTDSCLPLEMGSRHHPGVFLTWAWKMFRGRFIFAINGLLPDTDCIFWETARSWLMTESAEERGWAHVHGHGWAWTTRAGASGLG